MSRRSSDGLIGLLLFHIAPGEVSGDLDAGIAVVTKMQAAEVAIRDFRICSLARASPFAIFAWGRICGIPGSVMSWQW
jgi:hypothetical protein